MGKKSIRSPATGEMIKRIRDKLNFTKEQLAQALGINLVTIYRWENADYAPQLLARKVILELCKKRKIKLEADIEKFLGVEK